MDEQQSPQLVRTPSRLSQVGIVRIVLGLALLLVEFSIAGHGFSGVSSDPSLPNNSAQVGGYDAWTVVMYALGVWLVFSGIRKGYRKRVLPQKPQ